MITFLHQVYVCSELFLLLLNKYRRSIPGKRFSVWFWKLSRDGAVISVCVVESHVTCLMLTRDLTRVVFGTAAGCVRMFNSSSLKDFYILAKLISNIYETSHTAMAWLNLRITWNIFRISHNCFWRSSRLLRRLLWKLYDLQQSTRSTRGSLQSIQCPRWCVWVWRDER